MSLKYNYESLKMQDLPSFFIPSTDTEVGEGFSHYYFDKFFMVYESKDSDKEYNTFKRVNNIPSDYMVFYRAILEIWEDLFSSFLKVKLFETVGNPKSYFYPPELEQYKRLTLGMVRHCKGEYTLPYYIMLSGFYKLCYINLDPTRKEIIKDFSTTSVEKYYIKHKVYSEPFLVKMLQYSYYYKFYNKNCIDSEKFETLEDLEKKAKLALKNFQKNLRVYSSVHEDMLLYKKQLAMKDIKITKEEKEKGLEESRKVLQEIMKKLEAKEALKRKEAEISKEVVSRKEAEIPKEAEILRAKYNLAQQTKENLELKLRSGLTGLINEGISLSQNKEKLELTETLKSSSFELETPSVSENNSTYMAIGFKKNRPLKQVDPKPKLDPIKQVDPKLKLDPIKQVDPKLVNSGVVKAETLKLPSEKVDSVDLVSLFDFWDNTKKMNEVSFVEDKREAQVWKVLFRWSYSEKVNTELFNNPSAIEDIIKRFSNDYVFQLERGPKTNLLHYQGWMHFRNFKKHRPKVLAKMLNPIFYGIEVIRVFGSDEECRNYCSKDETRVSGPFPLGKIYRGEDVQVIKTNPYPWQEYILDRIENKYSTNKILYIWDPEGGSGKTTLVKYLFYYNKGTMINWALGNDIMHMASLAENKDVFLVDLARNKPSTVTWASMYGNIEQLQTGSWTSGKYQGHKYVGRCPLIFVFSNTIPFLTMLSFYKWEVMAIEGRDYDIWTEHELKQLYNKQKEESEIYQKKKKW